MVTLASVFGYFYSIATIEHIDFLFKKTLIKEFYNLNKQDEGGNKPNSVIGVLLALLICYFYSQFPYLNDGILSRVPQN